MEKSFKIKNIISHKFPLVRILLNIKTQIFGSLIYFSFIIFMKFLGLILISLKITSSDANYYSFKFVKLLRNLTSFRLFSTILSYQEYSIICYIILFLLVLFIITFMSFYFKVKNDKKFFETENSRRRIKIFSFILNILMFFHQHLLEFVSLIFLINFNIVSQEEYTLFNYFISNSFKSENIIIFIVNISSILLLNIFQYYCFDFINEPFFNTNFCINHKFTKMSNVFLLFASNIGCFHYLELFILNANSLFYVTISIYIITIIFIFVIFLSRYRTFNFENFINQFIKFIITFIFFSMIIQTIFYITNTGVRLLNHLILLKFTIACLMISSNFLINYIQNRIFSKKCEIILFKIFDGKIKSAEEIEIFYQFVNLLIKQSKFNNYSKIINILTNHKKECGNENCKCNIINLINKNFNYELCYILESIFSKSNLSKLSKFSILYLEFLFYLKESHLFSYMIANSYIKKNINTISTLEMYQFNLLSSKLIDGYLSELKKSKKYVNFVICYNSVQIVKKIDKIILRFLNNFEILLNFKEKLDNSLKIQNDKTIDSHILPNLNDIILRCIDYQTIYKEIKTQLKIISTSKICVSYELKFKIYILLMQFNKKIPISIQEIVKLESNPNSYDLYDSENYIESLLKNFLKIYDQNLNIIIEIKNSFDIKYFSERLSKILGYEPEKLINNDIHMIFPPQLRELHKKSITEFFIIKKKSYFTKNTFMFTSNNNMIPITINSCALPNLRKNLSIIASIKILDSEYTNDVSFIVGDNYQLISLSKSFEKNYSIGYEMIHKVNIDILKLFDIGSSINENFKSQIDKCEKLNQAKKIDPNYSFYNYFFTRDDEDIHVQDDHGNVYGLLKTTNITKNDDEIGSNKEDIKLSVITNESKISISYLDESVEMVSNISRKPILAKKSTVQVSLKELNTNNNKNTNMQSLLPSNGNIKIVKSNDSKNYFFINREKYKMINYMQRIFNIGKDLHLDYIYQSKLNDCINFLNRDNKISFKIKIEFRKLFDVPFYVVYIYEKFHSDTVICSLYKDSQNNITNLLSKKNLPTNSSKKLQDTLKFTKTKNYGDIVKDKLNSQSSLSTHNNQNSTESYLNKSSRKLKLKNKKEKTINKSLFYLTISFMFINVLISICILYFKEKYCVTIESMFSLYYSNHMRDNSLTFLHSSIISLSLILSNVTTFQTIFLEKNGINVTIDDIQLLLSQRIKSYRDNLFIFSEQFWINSNKIDDLDKLLYDLYSYNKILLSWEEITFESDFFSISNYISQSSSKILLEKNYSYLTDDIKNKLMFKNYKKFEKYLQLSKNSGLIYFLNENLTKTLYEINEKIKNILIGRIDDYNKNYKNNYLILQLSMAVISLIILIVVNCIFLFLEKRLFKTLLSMFLNLNKGKKNNFRSYYESQYLRFKIEIYKQLLKKFDDSAIKNTGLILNEIYNVRSNTIDKTFKNKTNHTNLSNQNLVNLNTTHLGLGTDKSLNSCNTNSTSNPSNFDKILDNRKIKTTVNLLRNIKQNAINGETFNLSQEDSYRKHRLKDNEKERFEKKDDTFISNNDVLKKTRMHKIKFISILKFSVLIILIISTILSVLNLFMDSSLSNTMDDNIQISDSFIKFYPILVNLFNNLRLLIFENDSSKINRNNDLKMDLDSDVIKYANLINNPNNNLLLTGEFTYSLKNSTDNIICYNNTVCNTLLKSNFNSKGLFLSFDSVIHSLDNIFKDYLKLINNSQINSKDIVVIETYFFNEEFANLNLQIEYLYENISNQTNQYLSTDMANFLNNLYKIYIILGVLQVLLTLLIFIYSIITFPKLYKRFQFVKYTSKKFNMNLFEI